MYSINKLGLLQYYTSSIPNPVLCHSFFLYIEVILYWGVKLWNVQKKTILHPAPQMGKKKPYMVSHGEKCCINNNVWVMWCYISCPILLTSIQWAEYICVYIWKADIWTPVLSSATGRVGAYSALQRSNWLLSSGGQEKLTTNRKFLPPVVIIRRGRILKMTH